MKCINHPEVEAVKLVDIDNTTVSGGGLPYCKNCLSIFRRDLSEDYRRHRRDLQKNYCKDLSDLCLNYQLNMEKYSYEQPAEVK
jgi:hypothetical protein